MKVLVTESKVKQFINKKLGDKLNVKVIENITEFPFEYDFFKTFPKVEFDFPLYELFIGNEKFLALKMQIGWWSKSEFENEWVVIPYNELEYDFAEEFLSQKEINNLGLSLKDIIEIYLS